MSTFAPMSLRGQALELPPPPRTVRKKRTPPPLPMMAQAPAAVQRAFVLPPPPTATRRGAAAKVLSSVVTKATWDEVDGGHGMTAQRFGLLLFMRLMPWPPRRTMIL